VFPALGQLYDEIWVYGLPEIFDPLAEIPGVADIADRLRFTGYLRRELPAAAAGQPEHVLPSEPFILVTTGGGGDGADLMDWVIGAYESDPFIPYPAVLLFGPFLHRDQRATFQERVARQPRLTGITFDNRVEALYPRALGVIAMGGYNTFCEILSFGRPAVVVPRTEPRLEQYLRAERAQRLGLLRMLTADRGRDPRRMATMIRALPHVPVASEASRARMLCGLDRVAELAAPWLGLDEPRVRRTRFA
jgi:predicted glycosyltransferase